MSVMRKLPSACVNCELLPGAFYAGGPENLSRLQSLRLGSKTMRAGQFIYREGEQASTIHILFDGWAIRQKLLPDGRRQILSFLLPGDPLGLPLLHADRLPFSVQALTPVSFCSFERAAFAAHIAAQPQLAWQADHMCAAATRAAEERLVDIGRRTAYERVGRLLLELSERLKARNLGDERGAQVPVRQAHLADSLGLTAIHVGRVLRRLRDDGILTLAKGRLEIHNLEALRQL